MNYVDTSVGRLYRKEDVVDDPRGHVLIVHGYGEHSGRYDDLSSKLNADGFQVGRFDFIGHGHSELIDGRRAYIDDFRKMVICLREYLHDYLVRKDDDKPVFFLSQSLGGLVLIDFLSVGKRQAVKGAILCSPALQVSKDISPLLQKVSGVVGTLFPTLRTVKLDSNHLSRTATVAEDYDKDPLVYHQGVYAKTGMEILQATKRLSSPFPALSVPVLVLHGTSDKITDPEGSRRFYDAQGQEQSELKLYENAYHELLREPMADSVYQDILHWLMTQSSTTTAELPDA